VLRSCELIESPNEKEVKKIAFMTAVALLTELPPKAVSQFKPLLADLKLVTRHMQLNPL
jgi:hypothetical protein